jgi:galactokinase
MGEEKEEECKARNELRKAAKEYGLDVFGDGAKVRRTSSRFCLGVEHGDYNGTDLFGVGTDRFIWFAYKSNGTRTTRLYSVNFPSDGVVQFDCGTTTERPPSSGKEAAAATATAWSHFARGVDYILSTRFFSAEQLGRLRGVDGVLYGNIPGGGMSRSASLTINLLLSVLDANGVTDPDPMRVVDLSQAVENDFVGSPCGNLDQIMIMFARANCGTLYSPARRTIEHVRFGGDSDKGPSFRLLVLDTGTTRHGLEKSTYSVRAAECRELVAIAGAKHGFAKLADVRSEQQLAAIRADPAVAAKPGLARRLQYIFEAQRRFAEMVAAWRAGDIATVGRLFRLDGIGLRDQYEISGPELEAMCDIVRTVPGVLGERMLGGGDKGASGLLCVPEAVPQVRAAVATSYPRGHPDYASKWAVHECRFVQGVTLLDPLNPDDALDA